MKDNFLTEENNYSAEDKKKFKEIVSAIKFDKPTILLGKPIPLEEAIVGLMELENKNVILFLPLAVSHHNYYHYIYRGKLIEFENPVIIVQNKEFLEVVLKDQSDCQIVRCIQKYSLNTDGMSEEEKLEAEENIVSELTLEILTLQEAKDMYFNKGIDIRD